MGIWTAIWLGEGGIWTLIFQKFKCPGGCPGGMLKLRFQWFIILPKITRLCQRRQTNKLKLLGPNVVFLCDIKAIVWPTVVDWKFEVKNSRVFLSQAIVFVYTIVAMNKKCAAHASPLKKCIRPLIAANRVFRFSGSWIHSSELWKLINWKVMLLWYNWLVN